MNRLLICIYLIVVCSNSSTGQIKYTPVFIDECTNEVADIFWYLRDSGEIRSNIYPFKSTTVSSPGTYFLYSGNHYGQQPIKITITQNKPNVDTFLISSLRFNQYVGYADYTFCDSLANGHLKSYYPTGQKHLVGTFKDGQVLDSLHEFYQNGGIKEIFIPSKRGWKMTRYFENGNVQLFHDIAKREEREYYTSGVLKKDNSWDSKYRHKIKEYDELGNLILVETHKMQKKLYPGGRTKSIISRTETLKLDRVFSMERGRFYEYNWTSFDSNGTKTRNIIFYSSGFLGTQFPRDYKEIDDFLFHEIVFYKNDQPVKKIHFHYKKEGNDYIKYLVLSGMTNAEWKEEKEITANNVYEVIASISQ